MPSLTTQWRGAIKSFLFMPSRTGDGKWIALFDLREPCYDFMRLVMLLEFISFPRIVSSATTLSFLTETVERRWDSPA